MSKLGIIKKYCYENKYRIHDYISFSNINNIFLQKADEDLEESIVESAKYTIVFYLEDYRTSSGGCYTCFCFTLFMENEDGDFGKGNDINGWSLTFPEHWDWGHKCYEFKISNPKFDKSLSSSNIKHCYILPKAGGKLHLSPEIVDILKDILKYVYQSPEYFDLSEEHKTSLKRIETLEGEKENLEKLCEDYKSTIEDLKCEIDLCSTQSSIGSLIHNVKEFTIERDWDQFNNGKDLAIALSLKANELLESFLWKNAEDADIEKIKEELADVFNYAFLMSDKYKLDVAQIVLDKMAKNAEKYPVDKAK